MICRKRSAWERRYFRAGINTVHWRLRRAPCPQWNSCSVAHIQPPSPALSADHFKLIFEKERDRKKKEYMRFPSSCGGLRVQPCVSRTARILKVPHFFSPHTPDSNRWALLLLSLCFPLFPSVTKHINSGLSVCLEARSWVQNLLGHNWLQ